MLEMKSKKEKLFNPIVICTITFLSAVGMGWILLELRSFNNTVVQTRENYAYSYEYPFLTDISSARIGGEVFIEGTASSWSEVKSHPKFRKFEWQKIDEEYGELVECYKFCKIHDSQTESYKQDKHWRRDKNGESAFYEHRIYRGFFASQERGERIRIDVFFDLDSNRFFYHFDVLF